MTIYIPLLVCALGAIAYFVAANAKVVELARIAFFAGLLVSLMTAGALRLR